MLAVLERAVAPIARAHDVTLAQVVLAWTAAQPGVTSVLVGARTAKQAAENSAAARLVLAPEELQCLDRAFRSGILREPSRGGFAAPADACCAGLVCAEPEPR